MNCTFVSDLRSMACDENHKSSDSAFALPGIKSHKVTTNSYRLLWVLAQIKGIGLHFILYTGECKQGDIHRT